MTCITIPGEPIGQPRQRHGVVNGRVRNWTPTRHPVNEFKAALRLAWQAEAGAVLDGPVRVDVVLVFARPKGKVWKTKPMPRYRHTAKPDAENVAKAVLDALTGLAYRDDAQVSVLTIAKWVAAGDEGPHATVWVEAAESEET